MAYQVKLTTPAEEDAYAAFEYIWRESSMPSADHWLKGLFAAIFSLAHHPHRCVRIPETGEFEHDFRQLLYGQGTSLYRIIFDIQEASEAGPQVRVLRIRHGSRDHLRLEDLDNPH